MSLIVVIECYFQFITVVVDATPVLLQNKTPHDMGHIIVGSPTPSFFLSNKTLRDPFEHMYTKSNTKLENS